MQNEPNLRNEKMNLNFYTKTDYEEKHLYAGLKNEPKQTQSLPSEALAKEGQTHRQGRRVFVYMGHKLRMWFMQVRYLRSFGNNKLKLI